MSFQTILIANRGEIAVRVIRTAKALGYRTVAVYSEPDANAPHVRAADEAILIGAAPVAESYLDAERVLRAAKEAGAEAVHPGYGFLSENAEFARACEAAGLVFIGPPPDAIDLMGNKAEAKRRMIEAGVPCVPGYEGEDQADAAFISASTEIGFPVMVKAAAGGGGRGMRLVEKADDLPTALELARSEASGAFGSAELILERAIIRPRHVEVQVFADSQGNTIHLGERDCSVQRRHQKVIEEAPCPVMTEALREKMGQAAVEAARNIGYRGAGTVEFLLDESGEFFFLEMNTRLQVEHPVTEEITGLDLVALQIAVAQGQELGIAQSDVQLTGHAIEVRLYAEDPAGDFLPSTGAIDLWQPPTGEGVRVDAGIATGGEVSPFYDAMVAKIVAHGPTRDIARRRLIRALNATALFGPETNRDFLIAALENPVFAEGGATTAFIGEEMTDVDLGRGKPNFELVATGASFAYLRGREAARERALSVTDELMDWSSSGSLASRFSYQLSDDDDGTFELTVSPSGRDALTVTDGEQEVTVSWGDFHLAAACDGIGSARFATDGPTPVTVAGKRRLATALASDAATMHLAMDGQTVNLRNRLALGALAEEDEGGANVRALMHGMLLEVAVMAGQEVRKGERLAVLEAMKMQHEITAGVDGKVLEVRRAAGEQVAADDLLIEIEPSED